MGKQSCDALPHSSVRFGPESQLAHLSHTGRIMPSVSSFGALLQRGVLKTRRTHLPSCASRAQATQRVRAAIVLDQSSSRFSTASCGFGTVGVRLDYYPTGIAAAFAFLLTYC